MKTLHYAPSTYLASSQRCNAVARVIGGVEVHGEQTSVHNEHRGKELLEDEDEVIRMLLESDEIKSKPHAELTEGCRRQRPSNSGP